MYIHFYRVTLTFGNGNVDVFEEAGKNMESINLFYKRDTTAKVEVKHLGYRDVEAVNYGESFLVNGTPPLIDSGRSFDFLCQEMARECEREWLHRFE